MHPSPTQTLPLPERPSWSTSLDSRSESPLSSQIAAFDDQPRIVAKRRFISVNEARHAAGLTARGVATVSQGRETFRSILHGDDSRTVVIAGPCSIHDLDAALEYAARLKALSDEIDDRILLLMRVYLEKPRTTTGWKGLLSDPHLDGSNNMRDGVLMARRLLCEIADLGVPTATELLDPILPAYLGDLVSWVAIGARTTESQIHRQMASGLAAPVGFKNSTDGGIETAVNAITAAGRPHAFPGVDDDGLVSIIETSGNQDAHVVLRGGQIGGKWVSNHRSEDIAQIEARLAKAGLPRRIMLDCSHANSGYDYRKQSQVAEAWMEQRRAGNASVFGLMFESNLNEGQQGFAGRSGLKRGVSITDACIGWAETEDLLRQVHAVSV